MKMIERVRKFFFADDLIIAESEAEAAEQWKQVRARLKAEERASMLTKERNQFIRDFCMQLAVNSVVLAHKSCEGNTEQNLKLTMQLMETSQWWRFGEHNLKVAEAAWTSYASARYPEVST